MPVTLIVKSTDAAEERLRTATAQRALDCLGNELPDRRLLCFLDDEEWQTFKDSNGDALDGRNSQVYVLIFPASKIPPAERFWSITAYTPDTIELIRNPLKKYAVASYTPGLVTNQDGSISIYMSREQPSGVPQANWLPVANRPFNIMLRCYGSTGTVAAGTYVPPAVERIQ